jgi:hypothetical protein
MADSGSTTVNFGAFPGTFEAKTDVSTPGVLTTSLVEAWLLPISTADHSQDEHIAEYDAIEVFGYCAANGTLSIIARPRPINTLRMDISEGGDAQNGPSSGSIRTGAEANRLFGQYTVGWVWT